MFPVSQSDDIKMEPLEMSLDSCNLNLFSSGDFEHLNISMSAIENQDIPCENIAESLPSIFPEEKQQNVYENIVIPSVNVLDVNGDLFNGYSTVAVDVVCPPVCTRIDTISKTNEAVVLDKYLGAYGFRVYAANPNGKKTIYCSERNKFYCSTGTYEFNIAYNSELTSPDRMYVRGCLVYTDAEHQEKPVKKCINCVESQRKLAENTEEQLGHIFRIKEEAVYVTSQESGRDYVIFKLQQPELGSAEVKKRFVFTCRSSCKSDDSKGIGRRATALIFTLFDENYRVCGRDVMNIRICSAPFRDYKSDQLDIKGQKRKRRCPSSNRPTDKPELIRAPVAVQPKASGNQVHSSQESSSQESVYEMDSIDEARNNRLRGVKLKKLFRDSRAILRRERFGRSRQRKSATRLLEILRCAQNIVEDIKQDECA